MGLVLNTKNIVGRGTFGDLTLDGKLIALSIEREWVNNRRNVSCIQSGTYSLVWHDSPKFGRRLHLVSAELGVSIDGDSLRNHCLFHPANWPEQLSGCIGLGDCWIDSWGVGNSRVTTEEFEQLIASRPDLTTITINRSI